MPALGVSPAAANARVASLSDAEVAQAQGGRDSMPAGWGLWDALVGAGVLIRLVLLVADIFGLSPVFGFSHKTSVKAGNENNAPGKRAPGNDIRCGACGLRHPENRPQPRFLGWHRDNCFKA